MKIRIKIAKWLAPEVFACAEKDATAAACWEETAGHYLDGQEFYRGLVVKIGNMYGVAAKTSDDGSVQDSVLALKVPELVAKTKELYADLEGANANLWLKLEWAKKALNHIAGSRTRNPNATVKRMADIAESALKNGKF